MARKSILPILLLFFVSGFTALVLEVVWAKEACLIFGNTTFAYSSVIAAFMSGLALGSYYFGKYADRNPHQVLRMYGLLEGVIGVFALAFPLIMKSLFPLYELIYLQFQDNFYLLSFLRLILSFIILFIPTFLMGGTFPLLSKYISQDEQSLGMNVSRLYGMNLFGAMMGSFISGFVLLAVFGLKGTAVIAALLNIGICLIAIRIHQKNTQIPEPVSNDTVNTPLAETHATLNPRVVKALLAFIAIHGFVAFVIQIAWTRILVLILGSSTYAFSAILTTYLAGLGIGTFIVSHLSKKKVAINPNMIGCIEICFAGSVLLFIPMFEWLIYYFIKISPIASISYHFLFAIQFIFCFIAMLIPTILMGLVYPSVLAYWGNARNIGNIVGKSYFFNTFGGVVGCFLVAFMLIPSIGLVGSLRFASILSILMALVLIFIGSDIRFRRLNLFKAITASVLTGILLFHPIDRHLFSTGVFIYASTYSDIAKEGKAKLQEALAAERSLVFYKEGISSTVSVLQYPIAGRGGMQAKSIRVNGKTDASTIGDMSTQLYLSYIPLLAHHHPEDVLVIGLGSGVSLGAVTQFDTVKTIDGIEIEPAVIEANKFFSVENHFALEDERVQMIVADGRNHLSFTRKKYDVIVSEPSNPWISGISNLFTKENYELALKKLTDDGIYCQWLHAYQMDKEDFVMILNTFASVFPQINLYKISDGDYFLLGSKQKIVFDYFRIKNLIDTNKYVRSDLEFFSEHKIHLLQGTFVLSDADLRSALKNEHQRLNTDNHLYLEYNSPKYLHQATSESILKWLYSIPKTDILPFIENWNEDEAVEQQILGQVWLDHGMDALMTGNYEISLLYLEKALNLVENKDPVYLGFGKAHEGLKNFELAKEYYSKTRGTPLWEKMAQYLYERTKIQEQIEKQPILNRSAQLHNIMAGLSMLASDMDVAEKEFDLAMKANPLDVKNYSDMASFYFLVGSRQKAKEMLQKAEEIDSDDPFVIKTKETLKDILE